MPSKKEPPLPDFDAMTPAQRVRALDALWDSMERYAQRDMIPDWHEAVVREREAEYKAGTVKMLTLDELKKTVRKALK